MSAGSEVPPKEASRVLAQRDQLRHAYDLRPVEVHGYCATCFKHASSDTLERMQVTRSSSDLPASAVRTSQFMMMAMKKVMNCLMLIPETP